LTKKGSEKTGKRKGGEGRDRRHRGNRPAAPPQHLFSGWPRKLAGLPVKWKKKEEKEKGPAGGTRMALKQRLFLHCTVVGEKIQGKAKKGAMSGKKPNIS